MRLNPKMESAADFDVFDDIGDYTDWWTGNPIGVSAKTVRDFLDSHPKVTDINVRINSNGGDLFEGISILNLLKGSGKNISVEVIGIAASSASLIAMAGDTVRIHPTAQLMIHNCWTSVFQANAKELRKQADDMDKVMESAKIAYLDRCGNKLTKEVLDKMLDDETYLSAAECVEYGFADEVIGKDLPEDPEEEKEEKPKPDKKGIADQISAPKTANRMPFFF